MRRRAGFLIQQRPQLRIGAGVCARRSQPTAADLGQCMSRESGSSLRSSCRVVGFRRQPETQTPMARMKRSPEARGVQCLRPRRQSMMHAPRVAEPIAPRPRNILFCESAALNRWAQISFLESVDPDANGYFFALGGVSSFRQPDDTNGCVLSVRCRHFVAAPSIPCCRCLDALRAATAALSFS